MNDAFEREIVCEEVGCGYTQRYRKPAGVSGRPPRKCGIHRMVWKANKRHEPRSWETVGAPYPTVPKESK